MEIQAFHDARQFVETSFGRTAYVERGEGPAAVLMHGAPLNGYMWRHVLDHLSGVRRCIAPDAMGLGYTEVNDGVKVTVDAQAQMLAEFFDALGVDQVDLAGNDSGGGVCQVFAVNHPGRVRSILLTNCEAGDYGGPAADAFEASVRDGSLTQQLRALHKNPQLGEQFWAIAYEDPAAVPHENAEVYLGPVLATPERVAQMEQYLSSFDPKRIAALEDGLRALDVPAKIVWGTADVFFGIELARWLDDVLAQSTGVLEVDGGKLFFPEERHDFFNGVLREFWSQVTAAPAAAK
jgi:pimeloyl-ACP methyl ester carboxylesterase